MSFGNNDSTVPNMNVYSRLRAGQEDSPENETSKAARSLTWYITHFVSMSAFE